MTVIAWDGNILAADRQIAFMNLTASMTKIARVGHDLVGWTGNADVGASMLDWYSRGADVAVYPKLQTDKDEFCVFLVVLPDKWLLRYERTPHPIRLPPQQFAIGSGCDFALAAMFLGKTAFEAVEIASRFDRHCGGGVDWMTLVPDNVA